MGLDSFSRSFSSPVSPCSTVKHARMEDEEPASQNLVSTRYRICLGGVVRDACITWYSGIFGHGFVLRIAGTDEQACCRCKVDIPNLLFWKRQRRKSLMVDDTPIEIVWDCNRAKYNSSPEPYSDYHITLVCENEIIFSVGDRVENVSKRLKLPMSRFSPIVTAKREHVFGKKVCESRACFKPGGKEHCISVECWKARGCKVPGLRIRIDSVLYLEVEHLDWQFRGNKTITVDGIAIDVFWDAHNWLFDGVNGYAVFMFEASKVFGSDQSNSRFGEEEKEEKCVFPLPSWSGLEQKGHAKDWLRFDSLSSTSSEDCSFVSSNSFSFMLISWRHDLKSRRS